MNELNSVKEQLINLSEIPVAVALEEEKAFQYQILSNKEIACSDTVEMTDNGDLILKEEPITEILFNQKDSLLLCIKNEENKISIFVEANSSVNLKNIQFKINDGKWLPYTESFTLDDGKYTIHAKVKDDEGNEIISIKTVHLFHQTVLKVRGILQEIKNTKTNNTFLSVREVIDLENMISQMPDKMSEKELFQKKLHMIKNERKRNLQQMQQQVEYKVILAEQLLKKSYINHAVEAINLLPDDAEFKLEFKERINILM